MNKIYNLIENHFTQNTTCASIEGKAKSNEALINILNTTATLVKSPDNIFVELDEIIPYKLVFKNTGDVTITKLEIIDALPDGIEFVPNSLKVNGALVAGNIETGITLTTPVIPGGQVTITFDGKVAQIPPTQYKNSGMAKYYYQLSQTGPVVSKTVESNVVTATAVQGILAIVKKADAIEIQKNDTILYTITITNTGNVPATNVVLTDNLPPQVEYIPNTFAVDGVVVPGEIDFVKGIPLEDIAPGETTVVNFLVRLIDDDVLVVPNRGTIEYEFVKDPNQPPVPQSRESNLVVVPVQRDDVSITKSSNKETVVANEIITFTLLVKNNGSVRATDLFIKDILPVGLQFVEGSIKVNGTPTSGNMVQGISISPLAAGASSTVTFEARVLAVPPFQFTNSASLDYKYTINQVTFSKTIFSNPVTVFAPFISISKAASQTVLKKGDTSTFTLVIDNKGRSSIGNLSISDILVAPLKLVPNSIKIDGVPTTGDLANLPIPELASGETTVVTFDVEVSTCDGDAQVINTATLKYTPSADLSYSITSNPVTIQVNCEVCNIFICAIKCVNTPTARLGEVLTYSIYINNPSNQPVQNVVLKDQLDPRLRLVPMSLSINGKSYEGSLDKVEIGTIPANGSTRVVFKAKIIHGCIGDEIDNTASIQYTGCENVVTTTHTNSVPVTIEDDGPCPPTPPYPPTPPCPPAPPCPPQPPCPPNPPNPPSCRCYIESVLTPIELPSYMKPIHKIKNVDGFIRCVKPMKYGCNVTKLLVTYVMTLEYCSTQGETYTHQELEEVCFEVKEYTSRMKVEIADIGEPCKVDCHHVEVIVRMSVCK